MVLYKYRAGKYIDMFKSLDLVFSPPSLFSDPFEGRPVANTHADELARTKKLIAWYGPIIRENWQAALEQCKPPDVDAFAENFIKKYLEKNSNLEASMLRMIAEEVVANADDTQIGVLSLSATPSSPLMWAQYADEHRGFVVGFDSTSDFFKPTEHGLGPPMKVQYSTERPTWSWASLATHNRFLTKSVDFMYEQEWRVLRRLSDSAGALDQPEDHATGGALPTAMRPKRHRFRFDPTAVKRVILGARMPYSRMQECVDTIRSDARLANIELLCAEPDSREYRMNIRPAAPFLMRHDSEEGLQQV